MCCREVESDVVSRTRRVEVASLIRAKTDSFAARYSFTIYLFHNPDSKEKAPMHTRREIG